MVLHRTRMPSLGAKVLRQPSRRCTQRRHQRLSPSREIVFRPILQRQVAPPRALPHRLPVSVPLTRVTLPCRPATPRATPRAISRHLPPHGAGTISAPLTLDAINEINETLTAMTQLLIGSAPSASSLASPFASTPPVLSTAADAAEELEARMAIKAAAEKREAALTAQLAATEKREAALTVELGNANKLIDKFRQDLPHTIEFTRKTTIEEYHN